MPTPRNLLTLILPCALTAMLAGCATAVGTYTGTSGAAASAAAESVPPEARPGRRSRSNDADATASASAAAETGSAEDRSAACDLVPELPCEAAMEDAIDFWWQVFAEFDRLDSVIHVRDDVGLTLEVLDFRALRAEMSGERFAAERAEREREAIAAIEARLAFLDQYSGHPEALDAEHRQLHDLLADDAAPDRYRRLIGGLRVQRGLRGYLVDALKRGAPYLPHIEAEFDKAGLPKALTRLPVIESAFSSGAYSTAAAAGMWQFIPTSAKAYGMKIDGVQDQRRDPWRATHAAIAHLRDDHAALNDWALAVTAYNHGRGGIQKALRAIDGKTLGDLVQGYFRPPFGFESRNYYARLMGAVAAERSLIGSDITAHTEPPLMLRFETIQLDRAVPYPTLRTFSGAAPELFAALNPAFHPAVVAGRTPVPAGHLLRVPDGAKARFDEAWRQFDFASLDPPKRSAVARHQVRRGETLGKLARRYRTTVADLRRLNDLRPGAALVAGSRIRVPDRGDVATPTVKTEMKPRGAAGNRAVIASKGTERQAKAVKAKASANGKASKAKPVPVRRHRVRAGETLGLIAQRYGVSIAAIRNVNRLNGNTIVPKQMLNIPSA